MVILSGYANPLSDKMLATWRTRTFRAKTHTDVRTETLWFNFEPPALLHDSRYLGDGFRQRQAAKRRIERIKEKFTRMDAAERAAIAQWLHEAFPTNLGSRPP
jgi:DNA adenine methylase